MTAAMASLSTAPDAALAWARGHGAFAGSAVLTDRPWAQTLRLDRADGAAYLKILPVDAASKIGLLTLIADRLPEATPRVLAADAEAGFILYADHGGAQLDRRFPPDVAVEILTAYAGLQTAAGADLVAAAPVRPAAAQLGRLIDFLAGDETGDAGGPVGAAHFLGSGTAGPTVQGGAPHQATAERGGRSPRTGHPSPSGPRHPAPPRARGGGGRGRAPRAARWPRPLGSGGGQPSDPRLRSQPALPSSPSSTSEPSLARETSPSPATYLEAIHGRAEGRSHRSMDDAQARTCGPGGSKTPL